MKTNAQVLAFPHPQCDWRTFLKFTAAGEIPRQDVEALDNYFKNFLPLGPCVKCGWKQEPDYHGELTRFKFGMQRGEGFCMTGGCNWPARGIHYNIGPIVKLELVLQYHPLVVTWDAK